MRQVRACRKLGEFFVSVPIQLVVHGTLEEDVAAYCDTVHPTIQQAMNVEMAYGVDKRWKQKKVNMQCCLLVREQKGANCLPVGACPSVAIHGSRWFIVCGGCPARSEMS